LRRKETSLNIKDEKVKRIKNPLRSVPRRTQFSKHLVINKKRPRFRRTSSPEEVDATMEVLLGFATAGPVGALMGLGLATLRTLGHMGISGLKAIRERAEEMMESEEDSDQISRSSSGW